MKLKRCDFVIAIFFKNVIFKKDNYSTLKNKKEVKMLISFIGLRGSGKTTQCKLLESYLISKGCRAKITKALDNEMKGKFVEMIPDNSFMVNVFLFCALYRRQVENILKLKSEGCIVIADRFIEHFKFFHKYYGFLKRGEENIYKYLEKMVFNDLKPDITIYLTVDLLTANSRIMERNIKGFRSDLMLETEESYKYAVEFYEEILLKQNCIIANGCLTILETHNEIIKKLNF